MSHQLFTRDEKKNQEPKMIFTSEGCERLVFFRSFSFMLHAINLNFNSQSFKQKKKKFNFSFLIYLHLN